MSFYLLYEPNHAFHAFTTTPELQYQISDPKGKIIRNVNFFSVCQNSDLSLKLNPTRQQQSRGMLNFKNRASVIKILKFYINRDNNACLEKHNFQ